MENELYRANETFRRVLQLAGDQPGPSANDACLGLARICYEWNDLDAAEQYAQQSLQLARLFDRALDRFIISEVFRARLKLARGDVDGAAAMLAQTEQAVRQQNFTLRLPEIAAAQVLVLLCQGNLTAAAQLAQQYDLPLSQARVLMSQNDPSAARAVLGQYRQQMEARDWQDERLHAMVLEALALDAHGEPDQATQLLGDALALAEPGGFIRLFVDEGEPMAELLRRMKEEGGTLRAKEYIHKLLAAFGNKEEFHPSSFTPALRAGASVPQPSFEPLSQRELEILKLVAQGRSNREIGERLFLALDTVKGHNRRIFDKLQVQSRMEAIARARELGLL
jgi:LuxR family maltose regulon positive regulatory protein